LKPYEQNITILLKSRIITAMMILVSAIALWNAWHTLPEQEAEAGGVFSNLPAINTGSHTTTYALNMALMCAVMFMMALINRTYILLHTTSILFTGLFMAMQAAAYNLTGCSITGITLCLTVMVVLYIMYATYQAPHNTRNMFLVFFLLASGSMIQWAYAAYIPVMLMGCVQMRCLNVRSFVAVLLGIITPAWILWGFSAVSLTDFAYPDINTAFSFIGKAEYHQPLATMAVTLTAGLLATLSNLIKIYGCNARMRAFNGILTTLTLATQLVCVTDFGHIEAYMPLLNCCTALQVAQYFRINSERRAYFPVILLLATYAALYLWGLWA